PIPDDVRAETAALLEERGLDALVARLTAADPQTAAQIDLANPRRVLRAWEVLEATGVGLAAWQAETPPPLLAPGSYSSVALVPERSWLYARCEARFDQMMAEGALEEARAVRTKTAAGRVDLKAVGANELIAYLAGDLSWGAAVKQAKMETRRYAKRQLTWIRNQMSDWPRIDPAAFAHVADGIAPEADRLLRFD
ncbi:MAG: tRNA dimethylallyltransferase, partial [Pseudomonadota bacterium]